MQPSPFAAFAGIPFIMPSVFTLSSVWRSTSRPFWRRRVSLFKIHALTTLLDQCAQSHPLLDALRPDMVRLSVYAVEFRYPGESAMDEDAKASVAIMKQARKVLRDILILEVG